MVYHQAVRYLRGSLILAFAATLALAEDDPAKVLERARIKQLVRAAKLPNYTCVETLTRDYYRSKLANSARSCAVVLEQQHDPSEATRELLMTDRLRLDVALTEHREIYSWVGASKFEDASVTELVRHGPIATGAFGALLAVVFGQDLATFHFEKKVPIAGRNLLEYSFQVESEQSSYKVRGKDSWIAASYKGSFQLDPETDEVAAITLETGELPASTTLCQTSTAMELSPVRIGAATFLLPKQGRQRFVERNGAEEENRTTFASCREYLGESTINYSQDETAGGKGGGGGSSSRLQLPTGLPFTFELTAPITAETAAAGDAFLGRLTSALRDKNGKIVAPSRSVVEGRLLRVEIRRAAPMGSKLVLNPKSIEIGGVKVPLAAERDWTQAQRSANRRVPILLPYTWERNAGLFQVTGAHAVMKAGFRSEWRTVAVSDGTDVIQ